jgi:energy-coupling factor transporter ATP-binding protein EcfA2
MSFLEIIDLVYRYPEADADAPAVAGLSLAVERGETVALVGANGAGKSTLARLVKGILSPQGGMVSIAGEVSSAPGSPDRRVGLLFSDPENQIVTSVVEEDVAFGLETLALPSARIKERVEEVLASFGLLPLRRALTHRLSGGEQQRVALAGVLAPDPDLLVLDEPTAFLDPAGKEMLAASLRGLRGRDKAILLITHDMEEAARADRVVLLSRGRVAGRGRPAELFSHARTVAEGGLVPPFGVVLAAALRREGRPAPASAVWEEVADAIPVPSAPAPVFPGSGPLSSSHCGRSPRLEGRGLHLSYGRKEILRGCDLSLAAGEAALLVGANGSGKSTLLAVLAGLLAPASGAVLLAGAPLRRAAGRECPEVAMLFQHPERQLFGETVAEDIAFGPRNFGVGGDEVRARVADAAGRVGLPPGLLARSPFHLSGGQQRRAALAGVLAMRPGVLLLDEPADGLDPAAARDLLGWLGRLAREEGIAVLVAAHAVPAEIASFQRLLVLEEGRIMAEGDPADLIAGGALPDRCLPPHLRAQMLLAARGARPGPLLLDPAEAAQALAGLVRVSR